MIDSRGQLTRYSEGSLKELWTISYPLILSILSVNIMIFVDRLILAKYDTKAMNAAVVAVLIFNVFQCGAVGIASISEVFVGQYNGAQKHKQIGEPVWQMIWFSLMTAFIFVPVGLLAGPFFISHADYAADGIPFFKVLMLFGPTFPLAAALSSFFIGRGSVKRVMITTIGSNILNIILDFLLIFGVNGFLPALGAKGAALATGISQTLQALLLLGVFLQDRHRDSHGTDQWKFKPALFFKGLRIGLPNAFSGVFDALAWSVLAQILAAASAAHMTVYSIGDSFYVLFAVGFLGLQKGVTAVAANYLGANREEVLSRTLRAGAKLVFGILLCLSIPMFCFPERLAELFSESGSASLLDPSLQRHIQIAMRWLWLYFMFDAISALVCGLLTAAGDTFFVMGMNTANAWLFSVIPTYFCVFYFGGSPILSWGLWALYGFVNALCFFLRYRLKTNSSAASRIIEYAT